MGKHPHTKELLFTDDLHAKDWLDYYIWLTPIVASDYEAPEEKMLVHEQVEADLTMLAWISKHELNLERSFNLVKENTVSTFRQNTKAARGFTRGFTRGPSRGFTRSTDGATETALAALQQSVEGRLESEQNQKNGVEKRLAALEARLLNMERRNEQGLESI